jgi:hypothetical protein
MLASRYELFVKEAFINICSSIRQKVGCDLSPTRHLDEQKMKQIIRKKDMWTGVIAMSKNNRKNSKQNGYAWIIGGFDGSRHQKFMGLGRRQVCLSIFPLCATGE